MVFQGQQHASPGEPSFHKAKLHVMCVQHLTRDETGKEEELGSYWAQTAPSIWQGAA